ncbi:hypothetical protein BU24DRAFT_411240 [Aaosphaeria arxii CBS 175.79]|uniref:Uncharacterized protein n=1 Tax=Aaosphaeria arxii CBS 175.79 TaxID=1450172 RepID=A0A6A5XJQ5_9PLEO|nr:uncharacterized protein BU24DRAFT_411240 [Aaosphaeria arxii CBS 175.79]KAF2013508.1 hypothetical protein BU24DRAFT_411240 [Aaosphaeria arxii CBS 175.79]
MGLLAPAKPLRTLLARVYGLPPELQELIFGFSLNQPGGYWLFDKEILTVLKALHAWPEKRSRQLSLGGSLFARWVTFGSMSYLAGLYEHHVPGSLKIEPSQAEWDRIVIHWNDSRIAGLDLVRSDMALVTTEGLDSVQIIRRPTCANLWVTMQGLFVSRIDPYNDCSQRFFWNSSTPLLCNDFPEFPILDLFSTDKDASITCLALEGLSGVTIGHCQGRIEAIYLHRDIEDSSHIYGQAHSFVTWTHCPFDRGETIVGIWLVRNGGTGLIINTTSKVAWLCPYTDWRNPSSIRRLALPRTKVIYHTSCMQGFGSIPAIPHQLSTPRDCGECSFPDFPLLLRGYCQYHWTCSMASLENVQAVRSCPRGGIELRYSGFRHCLGDFRPCEATDWCENPAYFKVTSTARLCYRITFFKEGEKDDESGLLLLGGKEVIFWSRQDDLIIEVKVINQAEQRAE